MASSTTSIQECIYGVTQVRSADSRSDDLSLKIILKDVASPPEIEEMIRDPHHELWKSRDLSQALQERHKNAYRPYIYIIKDMHAYMKRLASHLNIDRDAVSNFDRS